MAVCDTIGGTLAAAGVAAGALTDSVDTTHFSTTDAAVFETYTDSGTGLDAVRFLEQGLYLISCYGLAFAPTVGLTPAQVTDLRNTTVFASPLDLFGAGSYQLRTLVGDRFWYSPASAASTRGLAGSMDIGWRAFGAMLLDLPAFGDNLGDEYGITAALTAQADLVTNNVFPNPITASCTLLFRRLADAVPVASLPWW